MDASPGYQAVMRLAGDPQRAKWLPVVAAAYREAQRVRNLGGEFAGAWVVADTGWVPNLRVLAAFGILEKTGNTRAGRRAYYRMPDMQGVDSALKVLRVPH